MFLPFESIQPTNTTHENSEQRPNGQESVETCAVCCSDLQSNNTKQVENERPFATVTIGEETKRQSTD